MTWYADEIMLPATPDAIARLTADLMLRPFSYWIKELTSYDWPSSAQRHSLPVGGLLVIRPVCEAETGNASWYDEHFLDWESFTEENQPLSNDSSPLIENACDHIDGPAPPLAFRKFLSGLSVTLESPILYYSASTWAGLLEQEYSLSYQPHERLFTTRRDDVLIDGPNHISSQNGNALQQGLETLGVSLPSYFFAPHTRSFPWECYHL